MCGHDGRGRGLVFLQHDNVMVGNARAMLREQRTDALKDLNSLYKPKKCFLTVSWYNDSCHFRKSEPL